MATRGGLRDAPVRSALQVVCATLLFVGVDGIGKLLVSELPTGIVVWGRYASSVVVLLALLPGYGPRALWGTHAPALQLLRGASLLGTTGFMFMSVRYLPLTDAYAVQYTSPMLVGVLSVAFLRERPRRTQIGLMAIAFCGVLTIVRPDIAAFGYAIFLPLVSAFCYAAYQLLTRHVASRDTPLVSLFCANLVGLAVASFAWLFWQPALGARQIALMALMGLGSAAGHFLLVNALRGARASWIAPFLYVQIVWASAADAFLFQRAPALTTWIGAAIVITCSVTLLWVRPVSPPLKP
ncbi:DMT family transporter [Paraburkholderia sp.]|uniref:DMT family transporter n=1 Tax=Paraburkholderia sp. TaxID=1926495 RepID=UPI0039E35D73